MRASSDGAGEDSAIASSSTSGSEGFFGGNSSDAFAPLWPCCCFLAATASRRLQKMIRMLQAAPTRRAPSTSRARHVGDRVGFDFSRARYCADTVHRAHPGSLIHWHKALQRVHDTLIHWPLLQVPCRVTIPRVSTVTFSVTRARLPAPPRLAGRGRGRRTPHGRTGSSCWLLERELARRPRSGRAG